MDALTHNIESYLSPAYHPLCDGIALEGTRIAARALVTAVHEPGNLQARSDMMMASMMGAIAFQKDLGAVHSCAHALGAVCDLHHGLANALMIDTVLAWNYEAAPEKFDELAHVCKVSGGGDEFVPWLGRAQAARRHHRQAGRAWRQARADSAAGGDRGRRHLPPDQSPALHGGGLPAALRGGDVMDSGERLKIGISACFMHADPARPLFTGKTLQYVEQSIAHWVMSTGALAVMIPSPTGATQRGDVTLEHYAQWLDGLVLHGGADVSPLSYGEKPLQERWAGDKIRDEYEIDLVAAFERRGKPVFGVCRGLQLMNVAFGGTLYQDIETQMPKALRHRDAQVYDNNFHGVEIPPGSRLAALYPGDRRAKVNSIHHQAIKDLAPGFEVEALSHEDGIVEAIRRSDRTLPYLAAVQWHPEFHRSDSDTIDDAALLEDFLAAAAAARKKLQNP